MAGHRLGLIDPALYALGALSQHGDHNTGLVDITSGSNTFGGMTGYMGAPPNDL